MVSDNAVTVPDVGNLVDLQEMYDIAFPGNSIIDTYFDGYEVATGGLQIDMNASLTYYPNRQMKMWKECRGMYPMLRTAMPEKRQSGLAEGLLALNKRNMAAPKLQESVNEFEVIESTIEKAKKVFFDEGRIDNSKLETFEGAARWWVKQSCTAQKQMLADVRTLSDIDVTSYNFMIKGDVKPKLDLSPQSEYSALQTVVYPDKIVNALFGPIMKEINERIRVALKPHVIYNTRMTSDELDAAVEFLDVREDHESVEIDFSKFDKSKTSLHIRVVIELYKLFGLDEMIAYLWEKSQCQTTIKDRVNGIIAQILYQQKSGNCDTYGSNTWSAALSLLESLPLEKATFMIFGGDDSLIFFPKGMVIEDPCRRLASMWNFDCKLFNFKNNSFCGKFLIKVGEKYKFAPDPYKLLTKLGRKDIKNSDLLSEIFTSIGDNYKSYDDYRVLEALNVAVMERYKLRCDVMFGLLALKKYINSFDLFASLFSHKGKYQRVEVGRNFEW